MATLAFAAASARAEDEVHRVGGRSLGGQSGARRIGERQRMQREYTAMRMERAESLRESREEASGHGENLVPGWREEGEPAREEPADAGPREPPDSRFSMFLIYAAVTALVGVVFVRFRRGR